MISSAYIKEWRQKVPWSQNDQVEQDLIICRALVAIFSHPILADNLAFRGGTALYKLHLKPVRYSEFGSGRAQGVPCGVRAESVRETWRSRVHRRYRTTRGCRQWFRFCPGGRIRAQTIGDPDSRRTLEGKSLRCHSFIDEGRRISVNSLKMIIFVEK